MSKNYCFTLNNYTEEEYTKLLNNEHFNYIVMGKEVAPTTGTPHIQGYFQLIEKKRLTWIKKHIHNKLHIELCRGTAEDNRAYCIKDGKYEEKGIITIKGSNTSKLFDKIQECKEWVDVLKIEGVDNRLNYAREVFQNKRPDKIVDFKPRPFQQSILDIINQPADDRTIHWVYDKKGGKGKTFLSKYLVCNHNAFYFSPSKSSDILYAYNNEPIIICDIPRSCDEQFVNFGTLEKLKDGIYFSGKYQATKKIRQYNSHIIVFSNDKPPEDKFSADRIYLHTI